MTDINFDGDDTKSLVDSCAYFLRDFIMEANEEPDEFTIRSGLADWLFAAPGPRPHAAMVLALCSLTSMDGAIEVVTQRGMTSPLFVPVDSAVDRQEFRDTIMASRALRERHRGNLDRSWVIAHAHLCPECCEQKERNIESCMNVSTFCLRSAFHVIGLTARVLEREQTEDVSDIIERFRHQLDGL